MKENICRDHLHFSEASTFPSTISQAYAISQSSTFHNRDKQDTSFLISVHFKTVIYKTEAGVLENDVVIRNEDETAEWEW